MVNYRLQLALFLVLLTVFGALGIATTSDTLEARVQPNGSRLGISCADVTIVPVSECQALVDFYDATGGPNWYNAYLWFSTLNVCEWAGITCTDFGVPPATDWHVTDLNQHDNNLSGSIPGAALANLTKLEFLKLSQNSLVGSIPPELGQLDELIILFLADNFLTGSIPGQLATVPNLTSLGLASNQLTGHIPEALMGACVDCASAGLYGGLTLAENDLEGGLPQDIGRLDITTLDFRFNPNLTGPIPDNYAELNQVFFFGYMGTGVCTPSDPDIQSWLDSIQTVQGSGIDCVEAYSISGRIVDLAGEPNPLPITVNIEGSANSDQTDDHGIYVITGLEAGTYAVTPVDAALEFDPESREVTLPPDASNVNFTERLVGSIVTGRVTDEEGQPIAGVSMEVVPDMFGFTAADGGYVIDGLDPGEYSIIPDGVFHLFTPFSRNFSVPPDAADIDFTGTLFSFEPAVSAWGQGWDLDGLNLPPDPDLSSLLEIGDRLSYSCTSSRDPQFGPCAYPPAAIAFRAIEAPQRCTLVNLTTLPPEQASTGVHEASVELVGLPQTEVCDPANNAANLYSRTSSTMTLTLEAIDEGFLYGSVRSPMTTIVSTNIAAVTSAGVGAFSVWHNPVEGETIVSAYSHSLDVTPANPLLPPFILAHGQRVTITQDEVIFLSPLDHVFLPYIE